MRRTSLVILAAAVLFGIAIAALPVYAGHPVLLVAAVGVTCALAAAVAAGAAPRPRVPLLVLAVIAVGLVVVVASPIDNDLVATVVMATMVGGRLALEVRDRRGSG